MTAAPTASARWTQLHHLSRPLVLHPPGRATRPSRGASPTNIGVHFYDMLSFVFGPPQAQRRASPRPGLRRGLSRNTSMPAVALVPVDQRPRPAGRSARTERAEQGDAAPHRRRPHLRSFRRLHQAAHDQLRGNSRRPRLSASTRRVPQSRSYRKSVTRRPIRAHPTHIHSLPAFSKTVRGTRMASPFKPEWDAKGVKVHESAYIDDGGWQIAARARASGISATC